MKRKRRQRVMAILMALLMIVGLIPTDLAVSTANAAVVTTTVTTTAQDLSNGLKTVKLEGSTGTVDIDGTTMVIKESSLTGGISGTHTNTTYVYIPVSLSGLYKVSADITVDKFYDNPQITTEGVFMGVTTQVNGTAPFVSVAMRGLPSGTTNYYNMYRQNAAGSGGGSSGSTPETVSQVGVSAKLGIERRQVSGANKFYSTVNVTDLKNTSDVAASLLANDFSGYVFIAVNGTDVTIKNLKITNGDGTVVYDQATYTPPSTGTKATISNVTSVLSGSTVNVNWAAANGSGSETTLVEYSNDNGTTWKTVDTVAQNVTTASLNMADLSTGTYLFRVTGDSTPVAAATSVNWTQPRKSWSTVTAPTAVASQVGSDIKVDWTMNIGTDGADSLVIDIIDLSGATVGTKTVEKTVGTDVTTGSANFTVSNSGPYSVNLTAKRVDETPDKVVASAASVDYALVLTNPTITILKSNGNGSVTVNWTAVKEAYQYKVYSKVAGADDSTYVLGNIVTADNLQATVSNLSVGTTYTFKVVAERIVPAATSSATADKKAGSVAELDWNYAVFGGSSASASKNTYSGNFYDGSLNLVTTGDGGKLVTGAGADQIGFYYTKIDANLNFTLTAKVHVNAVSLSGGQDGFGLMAADAVDTSGSGITFYNNTVSTCTGKVEYCYNPTTGAYSETLATGYNKISMKNGIGARLKSGLTSTTDGTAAANTVMSIRTLENSCATLGTGTYNVIGNVTNATGTQPTTYTDLVMTIKRDNTGYRCRFVNAAGETVQETFYDYNNTKLAQLDAAYDYVGFFTARNANISVSDVSFTTISRADDAAPEVPSTTYVEPVNTVTSTATTGISDYNLSFTANSDGVLTVKDPSGNVIIDAASIKAGTNVTAPAVTLTKGANKFTVIFKSNDGFAPGEYKLMSSYDEVTINHTVTYKTYGFEGQSIWVSPTALSTGSGSKTDTMDIYTAVKYVQPGQTIVIKEGTYNLTSTVTVARGINGTAEKPINIVADPDAKSRPVFDFGGVAAGMVFGGDYWYIQGFDVTNSADGQKGLQLSGDNCTLDQVNTYKNGNSGVMICRLLSSDARADWPANNLVLNCSSYNNADSSYADADGFSAKLTVGDGNVFKGCIAYNNADDGWDLFAKVDTGVIGKVVVYNCIAYNNGFLLDGTNAGNGNGFKMGGESMTAYHELTNCIAYNNKAKGIDSNSCPDVQVKNCTTFNNGSYNVALYTNTATSTDFAATGVISFRTPSCAYQGAEQIKLLGTQDVTKVVNATNYFWNGTQSVNNATSATFGSKLAGLSVNSTGNTVTFGTSLAAPSSADASWFSSLDTTIVPTRDADGSINMNGLLTLTSSAPEGIGARLVSTPSKSFVGAIPASVQTGDSTHLYIFFTLSIMSGAALVGLYFFDKKRKAFVSR